MEKVGVSTRWGVFFDGPLVAHLVCHKWIGKGGGSQFFSYACCRGRHGLSVSLPPHTHHRFFRMYCASSCHSSGGKPNQS